MSPVKFPPLVPCPSLDCTALIDPEHRELCTHCLSREAERLEIDKAVLHRELRSLRKLREVERRCRKTRRIRRVEAER